MIAIALQGATLFLFTQNLGPAGFGYFSVIAAAGGFLGILFNLGTSSLALRIHALDSPGATAASIIALRYPSLAATVLTTLLLVVVVGTSGSVPWLIVGAALCYVAAESTGEVVESVLFGLRARGRGQAALIARRLLLFVAVAIGAGTDTVLYAAIGASVVTVLVSRAWVLGHLQGIAPLRPTVRLSLPYWGATLLAKLQSLDVVIASAVAPSASVGAYAAASRLTSPLNVLATSALSVYTPEMSAREYASDRLSIYRSGRRLMIAIAALLILVSYPLGSAFEWALGDGYEGTARPAMLLAWAVAIAAVTQIEVSYLFATGHARDVLMVRSVAMPISLGVAVGLGWWFGIDGVATAMVVLQGIQAIALRRRVLAS